MFKHLLKMSCLCVMPVLMIFTNRQPSKKQFISQKDLCCILIYTMCNNHTAPQDGSLRNLQNHFWCSFQMFLKTVNLKPQH